MGVRRCLARSLTSLALMRTPKSANGPRSNSFRPDSPSRQPPTGDGRLRQTPPLHRTWSVPDASSQPQLNLYLTHPLANCTAASKSGDDESFLHAMPTSFTIRSSSLSSVTPFRERERNSSEGRKAIPSPPWTI